VREAQAREQGDGGSEDDLAHRSGLSGEVAAA
jgi:hypothetical protein